MVHGLRIEDAPTLQELLAANQRLLARVGALLQQELAITAAVLTEWRTMDGLKSLLMDRALSRVSVDNSGALITQHCGSDTGLMLTTAKDGWRVLAFDDEIDNPLLAGLDHAPTAEPEPADELRTALPAHLHPAVNALLAASSDGERAAAVEQLRYQKPSLEALRHLIPLFLGDGAEQVREAARRLLSESGAQPSIYRLLAYFTEPDECSFKNLRQELEAVDQAHGELCIAILRAALEQQASVNDVLTLAQCIPQQLAQSQQLPAILGALLHHGNALALLGLVRRMQAKADSTAVEAYLNSLLGVSRSMDGRLITLLTPPKASMPTALIKRAVDLLLDLEAEPVDRMPIATALLQATNEVEIRSAVIAACSGRSQPLDSASLWLLGEWARDQALNQEQIQGLRQLLLNTCEQGDGPQVNTLLEQRLPALLYQNSAAAAEFIAVLGELAARTRASRNLDLIQSLLIDLAPGQANACWQLIEEHPHGQSRKMALNALPTALSGDDAAIHQDSIERLLSVLAKRKGERKLQEEAALLATTAARICVLITATDTTTIVQQLDDAASELGPFGWQALGLLAASQHCRPDRRSDLITTFLRHCLGEVSDSGTKEIDNSGNTTFVFDQSLAAHTHFVPDILNALERLCRSEHTPKPLLRYIVERLSDHFLAMSKWEVVWAPGNISQLANLLTGLAKDPLFPPNLRRRVVEALATRLTQPEMVTMLGTVLTGDVQGELSAHAANSLQQVIAYHADHHYLDDERGELCAALITFLQIPDFGDNDALIRNRIATTLSSLKRHMSRAQRELLGDALAHCDESIRQRLSWVAE